MFKNIYLKNIKIIKNFSLLSSIKAMDLLIPLITAPYLARVLGVEMFGKVAFVYAIMAYFILIVDFGFDLVGTKSVSINRNSKLHLSKLVSVITILKIIIISFCLLTLLLALLFFSSLHNYTTFYLLSFLLVLSKGFYPTWFYLGVEKMNFLVTLKFISRILFIFLILIFVKNQSDFTYVIFIDGFSLLIPTLIGYLYMFKKWKLTFLLPSKTDLINQFYLNWKIFISRINTTIYTNSNTFILGLFTTPSIVGYYAGAEKILKSIQGMYQPISQSIFPHLAKLRHKSETKAKSFIYKLLLVVSFFAAILSILLFIFSETIVLILLGNDFHLSIQILKILSAIPFLTAVSNILGVQTMIIFGMENGFIKIISIASLLHILYASILIRFEAVGIALALVLTELTVCLLMFIFLHRKNFWKEKSI